MPWMICATFDALACCNSAPEDHGDGTPVAMRRQPLGHLHLGRCRDGLVEQRGEFPRCQRGPPELGNGPADHLVGFVAMEMCRGQVHVMSARRLDNGNARAHGPGDAESTGNNASSTRHHSIACPCALATSPDSRPSGSGQPSPQSAPTGERPFAGCRASRHSAKTIRSSRSTSNAWERPANSSPALLVATCCQYRSTTRRLNLGQPIIEPGADWRFRLTHTQVMLVRVDFPDRCPFACSACVLS